MRADEVTISRRAPGARYHGSELVRLTGCEGGILVEYCAHGLIEPAGTDGEEFLFDDEAVFVARRLREWQQEHHIATAGLQIVADLLRRVSALESEVRFLREGQ